MSNKTGALVALMCIALTLTQFMQIIDANKARKRMAVASMHININRE